jgi:hypothetical protein
MTAGTLALTDQDQTLFAASTDGRPCLSFFVRNKSASAADALVNVPGLHTANQYAIVPPGETLVFSLRSLQAAGETRGGITSVLAHRAGAGVSVDFGVLAI